MIELRELTRYYAGFPALQDFSFSLEPGEIVGLLGLNGAGKSTTLKILAGLLAPSSGSVWIDGVNLKDNTNASAEIGFLPEEPPLYLDMTVSGFLRHIGRLKGMSSAEIERRLPEVVALTDLQGREDQVISTLSHGYKKRVGIAQAVIHQPKLVILDEPISGLDPAQIVEMRKVIRSLGESHTVVISSHILGEISQTCDRIVVIGNGRLVASGTEQELVSGAGQQERLEITVRGDEEAFLAWLSSHEAVASSEVRASRSGLACASVLLRGDEREALLAQIITAGFALRLVEAPADELEEIFLGLTQLEAK